VYYNEPDADGSGASMTSWRANTTCLTNRAIRHGASVNHVGMI